MRKESLDAIDLRILSALQEDGRMSNKDLADRVGLTQSPCLARVRRLEKMNLIERYMAVINIRRIAPAITVLAKIYMHASDLKSAKLLETHLLSLPQTTECFDVNGECDYIVRFTCRDIEDYSEIARRLLEEQTFMVRQILSYVVLREVHRYRGHDLKYLAAASADDVTLR